MADIPMTPWVRVTAEKLQEYGELPVTILGWLIVIGSALVLIFGNFWVKAVLVAYLLTP